MENETKQTNTNEQEPDIFAQKLREADSLYAILSGCTKEPYVYCDPETMDDAILRTKAAWLQSLHRSWQSSRFR